MQLALSRRNIVHLRSPLGYNRHGLWTEVDLSGQGFPSKPRAASEGGFLEGADETEASRAAELRAGVLNLGLAWGLVALCCTHHAGHMLHGTGLHEVMA